jgi:hypothetical protein
MLQARRDIRLMELRLRVARRRICIKEIPLLNSPFEPESSESAETVGEVDDESPLTITETPPYSQHQMILTARCGAFWAANRRADSLS